MRKVSDLSCRPRWRTSCTAQPSSSRKDGRLQSCPEEEMLSTQTAADFLNVSRQYLVRMVDAGELAAMKVGSHRRLRAADVAAFKAVRDAKRTTALNRLTERSEEAGGYAFGTKQR